MIKLDGSAPESRSASDTFISRRYLKDARDDLARPHSSILEVCANPTHGVGGPHIGRECCNFYAFGGGGFRAAKGRMLMQTEEPPKLSERLIASLDAARAGAACYVVLHHVANARGWSNGIGLVLRFGQEAVLVFFLLSGFVIFANERNRATRPQGYYLRRLRRIYPALFAAMLLSTLVAIDNGTFITEFSLQEMLGTLVSIQDILALKPGVIINPYLNNKPLWSLSYEVGFYAAFPFILKLWLRWPTSTNRVIGWGCCVAYVTYIVAPNHWSLVAAYFLVWWCGAMAAEGYIRGARDVRSLGALLHCLLLLTTIASVAVVVDGYHGLGVYPFLMVRHFAVALLMLITLFGPFGARISPLLHRISKPAAAVASVSYGLYVLHHPLLVDWHRARTAEGLSVAIILLVATSYFVDRKLNRWLPRMSSVN